MADLTFTIDVDADDAINSAKNLQDEIRDLFTKPTSGKLENQLDKVRLRINKIITQQEKAKASMAKLETKDFGNTGVYQKVLDKIELYSRQVEAAKKNVQAMEKLGSGSAGFQNATEQLEKYKSWLDLYERLKLRMEKQGKAKISPQDTQEWQNYVNKIENGNNEIRTLISAYNQLLARNSEWGEQAGSTAAKTEKRFSKLIEVIKKIPGLLARGIKNLGKFGSKMLGINKASEKHNMSLKKMINQVLRYGLGIRSLFILWRKLRAYTADALKLMATQFEEVNADVSALMNSFNQMKLSFGTMAQPLMHALAPALIYIIELITRAMTALANFFAILTGQKYIYKAQKANDSYADSIKGVGSAAKEANKELAEYDNLLVIDQPKDSGGGGGGGAADGLTGTFEKTLAESDFAKQLKDAINRGDWEGVGGLFANKLNIITKTFDNWINKKFRPKAVTWASRIGRILNGLTEGWDSNLTGKTIADTLNAILDTTNTFFKTYKFKRLGEKVGGLIKGFFDNMDPVLLGETLANKINAVIDFATGLIDTTPWAEIGDKLGTALKTWFGTVKWEDLGADLQKLASGILTSLAHFIQTSKLGTTVGTAINRFLSQIDFGQLAEDLSTCAISILDAIADLIVTIDWHRVGEAIADFLTHIDWLGLLAKLGEVALALLGALAEALAGLVSNPSAILKIAEALLAIFAVKKIWSMLTGLFSTNLGSAITSGISLAKVAVGAATFDLAGRGAGALFSGIASLLGEEELSKEYSEFAKGPTKYLVNAISTGVDAAKEYSETTGRSTLSNAVHMLFGEDITGMANANAKNALDAANEQMKRSKYQFEILGHAISDEDWEKFKNSCDDYVAEIDRLYEAQQKGTKGMSDYSEKYKQSAQGVTEGNEQITTSTETMNNQMSDYSDKYKESIYGMTDYSEKYKNEAPADIEEGNKDIKQSFYNMTSYVPPAVKEAMEQASSDMVTSFDEVPNELGTTSQSALQSIASPFDQTKEIFENRASDMVGAFDSVPTDLGNTSQSALESVKNNFTQDALTGHFTSVKDNIETPFKELPSFFSDTFKESWNEAESAFSSGSTTFGNFNSKLSEGMSNTINGLIDGLNGAVSSPLRKIQEIIEKFKNVKIGANSLFSNLPSFSNIPSIPRLAQGAVIPPNREFLATLGDQTSGTNIETPLATMVQAFKTALSEMGGSSNNQNIVLQLDGRTVAQCVWDEEDKRYKQTGRR